jgi:hypothetical protein
MHLQEYPHNNAGQTIKNTTLDGVRKVLKDSNWGKRDDTRVFRDRVLLDLSRVGWSDSVRIDTRSKISITSVFGDTGLCIQTGNISRYYADILKLETLHRNQAIQGAVYILPLKEWAKELGSNRASFERMVEELQIFEATITIPMMVFGISGKEQHARTRMVLPKKEAATR